MNRGPRIIEHGRAPAPRDGTRRPLARLAEHLLRSIESAVLVTLHSRRPADAEDDLLVWASIWFRGRATGKVPERRVPAEVLETAGLPIEEVEKFELEALVLELTGSLPDGTRMPKGFGLAVLPATAPRPQLTVLRPQAAPAKERGADAPSKVTELPPRPPRDRGFLKVLPGGLS